MSEYLKAFLYGLGWTACEAAAAAISSNDWTAFSQVNWDKFLFAVFVGCIIYIVKTKFWGMPNMKPAEEAKEEDVIDVPVQKYAGTENYDDLHVDDEGDDDDEMEQEE